MLPSKQNMFCAKFSINAATMYVAAPQFASTRVMQVRECRLFDLRASNSANHTPPSSFISFT